MSSPVPPLPDDEFLDTFVAALQADETDEAVYGWMTEESEPDVDMEAAGVDFTNDGRPGLRLKAGGAA